MGVLSYAADQLCRGAWVAVRNVRWLQYDCCSTIAVLTRPRLSRLTRLTWVLQVRINPKP